MKRNFLLLAIAALSAGLIHAQSADAAVTDLKNNWNGFKGNLLKAAEDMPEDGYAFVPGQGSRNFGAWVGHVADAQANACGAAQGAPKQLNAERGKTSKADLVAALKESIDICDAAYAATTAQNMFDPIMGFRGPTPRISHLYGNFAHSQECYGSMAVYLRGKSLVPPTSAGRGGGKGKGKQ